MPGLHNANLTQVAEAIRIGPQPMPIFGPRELSDKQVSALANYKLEDHAAGRATYYFWSSPDGRYLFFMIDIDVQKSGGLGTPEGARDFADLLHREQLGRGIGHG